MIFQIVVALVVLTCAYLYKKLTKNSGVLEAMGIPVVKPFLCFGSGPWAVHKTDYVEYDMKMAEEYGSGLAKATNGIRGVWGSYEGVTPQVYVMNREMIKEICLKKFDSFLDRVEFPVEDEYKTVDVTMGEPWKFLRKSLSPVFTSGKIKGMIEPIEKVLDKLITHLDNRASSAESGTFTLDAKTAFEATALEVIMRVAFGVEGDFIKTDKIDTQTPLYKKVTASLGSFSSKSSVEDFFWTLFSLMPSMMSYVLGEYKQGLDMVRAMTKDIIGKRESEDGGAMTGDFIDKLRELSKEVRESPGSKLHGVNEAMVLSNAGIFLLAGFSTTSHTLSALCFMLAKHPEIQQQVFDEIVKQLDDGEDGFTIDYESVNKLKFLEASIDESLRLFPPVPRNMRRCTSDVVINGLHFRKNTAVIIPTLCLHRQKEYFGDDALEFNPDRFYSGRVENNDPGIHSFGFGPRLCLGMRFVKIEMLMIMANILTRYEILEERPGADLKCEIGSPFIISFNEVNVKLKRRL